ncbi:hypothetical protein Hdeb2414_s0004g00139541 [Helianthus debilis subsp. tardiflorus]
MCLTLNMWEFLSFCDAMELLPEDESLQGTHVDRRPIPPPLTPPGCYTMKIQNLARSITGEKVGVCNYYH